MPQLDELTKRYKENINHLIDLCQNKTLAFDFDGTLTRFQYASERMLPCKDDEIEQFTKAGGNIYENIYILKTMQYIISQLDKENIFIVTSTVIPLREIKNQIIIQNFGISREHIIHTLGSGEKIGILKNLYEQTKKDILFLEDNYKILLTAEENLDFVKGYHISSLLA